MATTLTAQDLDVIGRARDLAGIDEFGVTARFAPDAVAPETAWFEAFGEAQCLLAERLASGTGH